MSASLQKRISEFKMKRLMSEDPGAVSDSEMDFKRRTRIESAKKQINLRMKLLYELTVFYCTSNYLCECHFLGDLDKDVNELRDNSES